MQLLRRLRGERDDAPTEEDPAAAEVRRVLDARHRDYENQIRLLRLRNDARLRGLGQ